MNNNRQFQRINKSFKCEVQSELHTFSTTLNISEGGVFISTPEPLKENTSVILYLYISEYDIIQVDGIVKWCTDDSDCERIGMGVEFIDINEEDKELIKKNL